MKHLHYVKQHSHICRMNFIGEEKKSSAVSTMENQVQPLEVSAAAVDSYDHDRLQKEDTLITTDEED